MHGARPLRSTRRLQNLQRTLPGWYKITNLQREPGQPEITQVSIYDEIGMLGVSAQAFLEDLRGVSGDIEMHINSPGGDVFDGIAIYNQLRQRGGSVHIIVDGLAASAASFIAQAASRGQLEMAPHSQMMIHDGFAMAIGTADDMRDLADQLDKVSDEIASIYAERSGKPADDWRGLMRAETWFSDAEAVEWGLADRVQGQDTPAQPDWDMSVFANYANANAGWVQRDGKWVFDPDNDGDDDSTPSGDSDHDYWSADGKQLKSIPPNPATGKGGKPLAPNSQAGSRWLNADKYKQADRDEMAKSGEAMPDGSYPIRDAEDLGNAIQAVGLGGADHDAIRKHIIKRAADLKLSDRIPDNWNADGSLQDRAGTEISDEIDGRALQALFTTALTGSKV